MNDRLIVNAHQFESLDIPDAGPRLTKVVKQLTDAINEDRVVSEISPPTNLTATSRTGGVLLTWDPVDFSEIDSLYGARIWRSAQSADAHTNFSDNAQKRELVHIIATTAWFDPTSSTASYIYWVQWVDRLNRASQPAGGKIGAGS